MFLEIMNIIMFAKQKEYWYNKQYTQAYFLVFIRNKVSRIKNSSKQIQLKYFIKKNISRKFLKRYKK